MLDLSKRYQTGLVLEDLFPSKFGYCACGCARKLPKGKRKWFSSECNKKAYIEFAIIKGDHSVIRSQLFALDHGYCRNCGVYDSKWQADHIIPVSQNGAAKDLSNFQTLCLECHKEKTNSELG